MMLEFIKKKLHMPRAKLMKILIIAGLIAIAGIALSDSFFSTEKSEQKAEQSSNEALREYERNTEKRLEQILSQIDGIGSCSVMITLKSSEESVFSRNREFTAQSGEGSHSTSEKNDYVIVDDAGEAPVLEKENEPEIRGVIVVCEGASNPAVKEAVTESLKAALGVSVSNICVVKGGNNG